MTVLVLSLIGDSIILVSTVKYNAIKLHKVIVAVMQNLAVIDILLALFEVLPTTVALVADGGVVGVFLGHVGIHTKNMCVSATVLLNCAMTILKLVYLKYPLRTAGLSAVLGHKICAALWSLMLCFYLPLIVGSMLFIRDDIYFDYKSYTFSYNEHFAPIWLNWYTLICSSVLLITPCLVLVVTSVLIFVVAHKAASRHGGRLRREGAVTVLLTVGVFFISFLPICLVDLVWNTSQTEQTDFVGLQSYCKSSLDAKHTATDEEECVYPMRGGKSLLGRILDRLTIQVELSEEAKEIC
ncbi:uncharacterized protein LOC134815571 [Bolinopsis microptera]|uniref:uncharacterized protein LOC134815571 n=1 Tax=Bolinopsis microptera TaxID=2820187 RepID=UPI00307A59C4